MTRTSPHHAAGAAGAGTIPSANVPPPSRRLVPPNASIKFSSSDVMKVHVENQPMASFKLQVQTCLKKSKGCLIAFNI
jgi:hypothetical protein